MKKKLLLFLPLVALTACNQAPDTFTPYLDYMDGIPAFHVSETNHVTYLMMSPYGELNIGGAPVKGKVTELFYENTIIWAAEEGTALPNKSEVVSTVEGATFRGWYLYNPQGSTIYPDAYTKVPAQSGLALKAIFDGKEGGTEEDHKTGFGLKFTDGTTLYGTPKGYNDQGFNEFLCENASFTVGKIFTLYDFANKATWIVDIDPYSFGDSSGSNTNWKNYISVTNNQWKVVKNFTADVYIKIKDGQDQIYFGLK